MENKILEDTGLSGLMVEMERIVDSDYPLSRMLRIQAQSGSLGMGFICTCLLYVWMVKTDSIMAPIPFLEMLAARHCPCVSAARLQALICEKLEMIIENERVLMLESLEKK